MRLDVSLKGTRADKKRKAKQQKPARKPTTEEALAAFSSALDTGIIEGQVVTAQVQQPWARAELVQHGDLPMLHLIPLRDMQDGTLLYVNGQCPNFNAASLVIQLTSMLEDFRNSVNIVLAMRRESLLLANTLQAAINRWATDAVETLQILGVNADDLYPIFPPHVTKNEDEELGAYVEKLREVEDLQNEIGVMPRIHGPDFLMTPTETVAYDVPVIFAEDVIELDDLTNIAAAFKGQTVFLFESGMFFDADPEGPNFWDVILDLRPTCQIVPVFLPSDVEQWAQLLGGKMLTSSDIATPGFEKNAIVLRRARVTADNFEFTT